MLENSLSLESWNLSLGSLSLGRCAQTQGVGALAQKSSVEWILRQRVPKNYSSFR